MNKLLDKLKKVRMSVYIIKSGLFSDSEITKICCWLGFTDTAFRDKKSKEKLKDYLLSQEYWCNKLY